jgi:hypothetical protein
MFFAITSRMPALSSLYGAVSRELPQPLLTPETMTEKPPLLIASCLTLPPRRPTRQYRASVSS